MKKPPDPYPHRPLYHNIKLSLKHILKPRYHNQHFQIINQAVLLADKITFQAQLFLKAYLLHLQLTNASLPHIHPRFITTIFKLIYQTPTTGRPPSQKTLDQLQTLKVFYQNHFKPFLPIDLHLPATHLSTILEYAATQILTNFENNIREHYFDHVETYVKAMLDTKAKFQQIKNTMNHTTQRKQAILDYKKDLREIQSDL